MLKLNTLLAKVESSTPVFRKLITDYKTFFEKKQGEFQGVRKTYTAKDGMKDEPSERQFVRVITTVDEKLQYLEKTATDHLNNVMAIEATNASGVAKVELIVEDISFGKLSSLELMKLKSIIEKEGLEPMYAALPVRSDSVIWNFTTDEMYIDRVIFETQKQSGVKRSIEKEEYILEDPNLKNMTDISRYTPVKSVRNIPIDLGDYTLQHFSGEETHRYRAGILARRSKLLEAINAALKEANDVQIVKSEFEASKLFAYLHETN
jgi:hypothetical protein